MNFFGNIFSDDHDGSLGNGDSRQGVGGATLNGQRETWGKQIRLYKEASKIYLLRKNEFYKSILSEAFNAQDENVLHLVLSHPMSSVLDEQDGRTDKLRGRKNNLGMHPSGAHERKGKSKNGESEEEDIIRIRVIGLKYFGNSFEDSKTSG
ncbi:hypothetical protein PCYB_007690 [Plasmodium cynomolgi strain B]|uniref:Uncharacterized protein n=1 Tax=Plasmodium cynomolgi (strain B) TaxID=1120755 RepID=K6V3T2_PLACD|nr:hypothetical protein PCYB_007690 [Plasmodium cynomolgi strain B]GAB70020.1 hypothetical protein PCYB_007690 [Plasmodium cynomolgi strain B]